MNIPASGNQLEIQHGPYRAVVADVGATLRVLEHEGRPLVVPFAEDRVRPHYRGAVLTPWPNRVTDGRYEFDGRTHQLALTEPARSHALHGLAAWAVWTLVERSEASVTLETEIAPQSGYPWRVVTRATYTLTDAGLAWTITTTNTGDGDAPYGTGPHPYLVAGEGTLERWTLTLPAAQVLEVTPERLSPVAVRDVAAYGGGELDFRAGRTLAETFIDHAFTDVARDADGIARVEVRATEGTGVVMTFDAASPWVQVHTPAGADLAPEDFRVGLAVEPMTCPPGAFNDGTDLIVLAPGATHAVTWGIAAL
ncbi:aldose 1-epimerase family protein [Sanguibacter sp. HDW7]|uniref:aldose 1-epimerase family protein n=1 Tax=Sanguibacter sp. HDW7 TaxID=2714931 RepID=UPI001F1125A0|nr:aldose 1-epimerase family protein [Sanguibacter sp. HDW7]